MSFSSISFSYNQESIEFFFHFSYLLFIFFYFLFFKKFEEYRKLEKERLKESKQTISPNIFFTKQTVQNACGTVGIIHSLANNKDLLNIDSEYFMSIIK